MRDMLGRTTVIAFAFVLFAVMFLLVMFFVNPQIDGGSGMDLLRLQLAFAKSEGLRIVQSWGDSGIRNFKKLIVFDYVYAFSYVLLLATLIGYFTKTYKGTWRRLSGVFICLAIFAGVFDGIENTLEIFFLQHGEDFSVRLFFFHSVVALLKWAMVVCVVGYVVAIGVKHMTGKDTA